MQFDIRQGAAGLMVATCMYLLSVYVYVHSLYSHVCWRGVGDGSEQRIEN